MTVTKFELPIQIGKIEYTNDWPIYQHFQPEELSVSAVIHSDLPANLNRGLLEDRLYVTPVSSFAYGTRSQDFWLLPDLSVSAQNAVGSILLFSRKPVAELGNGTIALTNTSATSVNLLKIILQKRYGFAPDYVSMNPNLDEMMDSCDAALLIGDHAIEAARRDSGYIVTDLGREWKSWTGHSMTFAVWAVNKQFAAAYPELVTEIGAGLRSSKQQSLHNLEPVIAEAQRKMGGEHDYWEHYFRQLWYDFGIQEQQGLALYFRYAYELGLLDHEVNMELWTDNTMTRVNE
ncbi:menaquinone biosynthesis protein [Paenibacillus sp. JQZ6Y-1]